MDDPNRGTGRTTGLVVCPFALEGTCHVAAQCGHSVPHKRRTGEDDPCGWGYPDRLCPDCRNAGGWIPDAERKGKAGMALRKSGNPWMPRQDT